MIDIEKFKEMGRIYPHKRYSFVLNVPLDSIKFEIKSRMVGVLANTSFEEGHEFSLKYLAPLPHTWGAVLERIEND